MIAVSGDPGHLNPAIWTAGPIHAVAGSMLNGLVEIDASGSPSPDLAEAWEASGDGLSMTFYLRRGGLWHDGQPFTAEAVKVTFQDLLFRFHPRARAGLATAVSTVDIVDPHTVTFRVKRRHPALLR